MYVAWCFLTCFFPATKTKLKPTHWTPFHDIQQAYETSSSVPAECSCVSVDFNVSVIIPVIVGRSGGAQFFPCVENQHCVLWWVNPSLSSQIAASILDCLLNCGPAGSAEGHFKDFSCVLPNGPLHKHCSSLHSCQPAQLVKRLWPFPLHCLLVTVIVCVCAHARACVCDLASLTCCQMVFRYLWLLYWYWTLLVTLSSVPITCPFLHCQENMSSSFQENKTHTKFIMQTS